MSNVVLSLAFAMKSVIVIFKGIFYLSVDICN